MEPNLISKFKNYFSKEIQRKISFDKNQNDTGINYIDLRSNDLWCLTYLILITFDFKFATCYAFDSSNKKNLISFNVALFIELYKSFCQKVSYDENFIYVVNSLLGMERFDESISLTIK
jgi:hypothetical protein